MWFCRPPKPLDPSSRLFHSSWLRCILAVGIGCVAALPSRASAQYPQPSVRPYQHGARQAATQYDVATQSQQGYSFQQTRPVSNQPQHFNRYPTPPIRPLPPANLRTFSNNRMPGGSRFEYENAISAPQKGTVSRFVSPFRPRVSRPPTNQNEPPIRYASRPLTNVRSSGYRWQEEKDEQAKPFSGIPIDQVPMPPEAGPFKLGSSAPSTKNRDRTTQSSSDQSGKSSLVPPGNAEQIPPSPLPLAEGIQGGTRQEGAPPMEPIFKDLPVIDDPPIVAPSKINGQTIPSDRDASGDHLPPIDSNQPGFPPNAGRRSQQSRNGFERSLPSSPGGQRSIPSQDLESAPSFDPRDERGPANPPLNLVNPGNGAQGVPAINGNELPLNAPSIETFELGSSEPGFVERPLVENDPRLKTEGNASQATTNCVENQDVYGNLMKRDAPKMWWDDQVVTPQANPDQFWRVGVNDLLAYFLENSPRVRAIRLLRDSSQSAVLESHAEFDPATYVETNFTRLNDPVGNELTTGGADRFKDDNWTSRAGLRQKMRQGGTWEAYQQLGTQTNNSDFFVPDQQGNAYLSLSFTQPLLNGRGTLYNESLIAIANLEIVLADGSAAEQIQQELLLITEKYWNLYTFRAVWFQRQENVRRAEKVYQELDRRADIDVSQTQLFRARAALATRKAALVEAYNNVRNVEVELAACLGIDARNQNFEFVPNLKPELTFPAVDVRDAFVTALSNRPELIQAGKKVQIAAEKANRSRHELKPVLDLLVSTYVSGLNEKFEFLNAWGRQFSDGAPGYSAGLNFEMPLHRRAAKARLERDELRWKAITSDLEDEILKVQSEVDIAVRNVDISYRKLLARETAMQSAKAELQAQQERMDLSLNEENLGLGLNLLLDSQDRLAEQENQLAFSQAEYMISWVSLKKAMGTLVSIE